MSEYLCTFSGKFGDILWSLATAKYIAERITHRPVDFAMMPDYESLVPLLKQQSYIDEAYVIKDWLRTHSNHGDQPWYPQPLRVEQPFTIVPDGKTERAYRGVWHLTYKAHPGIGAPSMPLISFIAYQQEIRFNQYNPVPFLDALPDHGDEPDHIALIAYAFNESYKEQKDQFLSTWLPQMSGYACIDVSKMKWTEAAWVIKQSLCFVGCRSACWVLANGLDKEILTFEPHPSRHKDCHLGQVFGNPYGREMALPFGMPAHIAAQTAAGIIRQRYAEKLKESEVAKAE